MRKVQPPTTYNEKINVFIISFNRVTWLPAMVRDIYAMDNVGEVYIIDNNSTYEPLLEYYKITPAKVIYLDKNLGHKSPWLSGVIEQLATPYYVVTDPDLNLSNIPRNCLIHLLKGYERYKHMNINKAGLALEIQNVPKTKHTEFVRKFEVEQMWRRPLDLEFFNATCDTTFALYNKSKFIWDIDYETQADFTSGIRSNYPYVAEHRPWYDNPENPSEEDLFVWSLVRADSAGWTAEKALEFGNRKFI
jgi:hypothetical protein